MTTFILILTLTTAGTTYDGKAIDHIEFANEKACKSAATTWKAALGEDDRKMATAICVQYQ